MARPAKSYDDFVMLAKRRGRTPDLLLAMDWLNISRETYERYVERLERDHRFSEGYATQLSGNWGVGFNQ